MTSDALLDMFRLDMKDTVAPYLWSDTEVYAYVDDAQKMFCRLTDGISDASTTAVVDIAVTAGETWLDLHPSILKIRGATRTSDGRELNVLNYEDCVPLGIRLSGAVGNAVLTNVIVGMEDNKLRLDRPAAADDAIKLLVFRLPLVDLSGTGIDLEIAPQHHLHLLKWAKSLALAKQDAETFNKNKAEEMEAQFRGYCDQVKKEQANKRHKVRMVAYGGIPLAGTHAHGQRRHY